MRAVTTTTTLVEPPLTSSRRRPVRQARANPERAFRPVNHIAAPLDQHDDLVEEPPGFFPALTYFTDATTQLPKEMIRHYTMLKEVEAKMYGPEERFAQALAASLKATLPPKSLTDQATFAPLPDYGTPKSKDPEFARRNIFLDMRRELPGLLATLDEKNHVMHTAIECLQSQLHRCHSSIPLIEEEISEEARLGSLTHWAYAAEDPAEKKGIMAGERTRRAVAAENQVVAARSEARRDAVAARKARTGGHIESDLDDARVASGRRGGGGAKGRKIVDAGGVNAAVHALIPPVKKRRVDQNGGAPISATSRLATNSQRAASPVSDARKRSRPSAANGAGSRRRGANTTGTGRGRSPALASSPVVGSFAITATGNGRSTRSPAPHSIQQISASRTRPESAAAIAGQLTRNRSLMSRHHDEGHGSSAAATTVKDEAAATSDVGDQGRMQALGAIAVVQNEDLTDRYTSDQRPEQVSEEVKTGFGKLHEEQGAADEVVVESADLQETGMRSIRSRAERPPSISVSRNGIGSRAASKAGTPMTATFNNNGNHGLPTINQMSRRSSLDTGASRTGSRQSNKRSIQGPNATASTMPTDDHNMDNEHTAEGQSTTEDFGTKLEPNAAHTETRVSAETHSASERQQDEGPDQGISRTSTGTSTIMPTATRRNGARESRQRERTGSSWMKANPTTTSNSHSLSRASTHQSIQSTDTTATRHPPDSANTIADTRQPTASTNSNATKPNSATNPKPSGTAATAGGFSASGVDEDDEDEPRYCYCNEISYGEMVGCDAKGCAREWFHLQCVGLTRAPAKNAKWYCNECKERMGRRR